MLKQTWPQMVISQCGPPAILASHPFRKERGKSGAPHFVCDLELRGWNVGLARPILRPRFHHTQKRVPLPGNREIPCLSAGRR